MTTILHHKVMNLDLKICELMQAKFCHDIAGLVGAIGNGIDITRDDKVDDRMKEASFELAATSASKLAHSLAFYRQAYGYTNYDSDTNFATVMSVIDNFLSDTKVKSIVLKECKSDEVECRVAKLVYNVVLMLAKFMLYSGDLKILFGTDAITLTSTAPFFATDEGLEQILRGETVPVTIRNVQSVFTSIVAQDLGYEITFDSTTQGMLIVVLKKVC